MVKEQEQMYWKVLDVECMSEESDNEDGCKARHTPKWHPESEYLVIHQSCSHAFGKFIVPCTQN